MAFRKKKKGATFSGKKSRQGKKGPVAAKKYLGQHFLKDEGIAMRIAETLSLDGYDRVLEIGPGTGVLTKYLLERDLDLTAMEIDPESILFLNHHFVQENPIVKKRSRAFQVVEGDFLTGDLKSLFGSDPFAITGNFPYNISTQIVFRLLEMRNQVPEFSGMFQKEVAQRICAKEGNKTYGILSVLVQAFYKATYLFTVPPGVFEPPPKVESGVLHLQRRENFTTGCDEALFFKTVKTAFNQRRKTLRNSLRVFDLSESLREEPFFDKRPEQLTVTDFLELTKKIGEDLA